LIPSVIAILTNTEEAINLLEYLNTKDVADIVKSNKQKACNTKTLFSRIPDPL